MSILKDIELIFLKLKGNSLKQNLKVKFIIRTYIKKLQVFTINMQYKLIVFINGLNNYNIDLLPFTNMIRNLK
jgi:hypothetical protein